MKTKFLQEYEGNLWYHLHGFLGDDSGDVMLSVVVKELQDVLPGITEADLWWYLTSPESCYKADIEREGEYSLAFWPGGIQPDWGHPDPWQNVFMGFEDPHCN
jgi:hypothetical protein